jgi:hydrogenase expression/formation protein HypE
MSDTGSTPSGFTTCPVPLSHRTEVTVGHGGGGRLTQDLIERIFRPAFANAALDSQHDGALLPMPAGGRLAFTTDSHVVSPLFFPGGDIGKLAVKDRKSVV